MSKRTPARPVNRVSSKTLLDGYRLSEGSSDMTPTTRASPPSTKRTAASNNDLTPSTQASSSSRSHSTLSSSKSGTPPSTSTPPSKLKTAPAIPTRGRATDESSLANLASLNVAESSQQDYGQRPMSTMLQAAETPLNIAPPPPYSEIDLSSSASPDARQTNYTLYQIFYDDAPLPSNMSLQELFDLSGVPYYLKVTPNPPIDERDSVHVKIEKIKCNVRPGVVEQQMKRLFCGTILWFKQDNKKSKLSVDPREAYFIAQAVFPSYDHAKGALKALSKGKLDGEKVQARLMSARA